VYQLPIVPENFTVPESLETEWFRLRMLSVHDAVKDYDAVMTSARRLQTVFRPGGHWPEGLTLEQNLIELAWHQVEFQQRSSFAYTVASLDESRILGCVYIDPCRKEGYDAEVSCWVRSSEAEGNLDARLFAALERWLAEVWPFANPGFPGRRISWEDWRALPERPAGP
jgi:hypothetical protein